MRSLARSIKFSREPTSLLSKALPADVMRSRMIGTDVDILPGCRVMNSISSDLGARITESRRFI